MLLLRRTFANTHWVALLLLLGSAASADGTWPREIETEHGILTVYQPQPEKFIGNRLECRAAASLLEKGGSSPTFGVFWFTAHVDTDRDAGTALVRDIVVTRVRWPDSRAEEESRVAEFLTGLMPQTGIPISLERLKASLVTAEMEQQSLEGLKHDPPRIVVVEEIAELLLYDGEPRSVPIPGTELEHMANAAFAVVRDRRSGTCYLSGGKLWYSAADPLGPWTAIDEPPADVAQRVPPDTSSAPPPSKPPRIVVATEPTELISTDGPPAWRPLGNGELMYVENTESPVVRELATGDVFVLVAGRWYRASSLEGPWSVVRPDQLPAAFQDIPPASDLGPVRVSVAGTPEAEDAMLDAQVPQTAAIDRAKAKLEVRYDGEPQFKGIEGTGVEYATNTAAQVLRIDGKYYACDEGVWFVSNEATGAWTVADSVPSEEIAKIPPSEPVYNVTHVTIYESTPSIVYVGYTPGYMWSFPWYGCPIYGTGWYYRPYWGAGCYYPRPVTYGMHVGYNPWTGWSFGFSYSTGFMRVGVSFGGGYGGYYRPGFPPGYYRPPCTYPPGGYRPPYRPPGYRPGGPPRPMPYGERPGTTSMAQLPASNNLYRQGSTRDRVAPETMQRNASLRKADRVAQGRNNVYAGRDGNVYRQMPGGWESRDRGQWTPTPSTRPAQPSAPRPAQPSAPASRPAPRPAQPSAPPTRPTTRPAQPPPSTRPAQPSARPARPSAPAAPSNLQRDFRARQQGAHRAAQQPRAHPAPAPRGGRRR